MGSSEEQCKWVHEQLEKLPFIKYPFELMELPEMGIYFFWGGRNLLGQLIRHCYNSPIVQGDH